MTFEVTRIQDIENAARVSLSGAIDASTVITFQSELDKLKKNGVRRFLLDMAGIRYVNSTGLGSLVKLADGLENEGGMIALMQIHPKVKVVFDMLGLNAFFKIFKTDQDALDFIKESISAPPEAEPIEEAAPPVVQPAPAEAKPVESKREPAPAAQKPAKPSPVPAAPAKPQSPAAPAPAAPAAAAPAAAKAPSAFPAPIMVVCAECGINIRVHDAGDFRCPRCFSILHASASQQVDFGDRRKDIPLQVTLTGDEAMIRGLGSCVASVARMKGFGDAKASEIGGAVESTCRNVRNIAYEGDGRMSYNVLVEAADGMLLLRFADHGKPMDLGSAAFGPVKNAVTEITHIRHPRGGNILRITKKA